VQPEPTITIVSGSDWTQLYVNDDCVEENHSISLTHGLDALDIPYQTISVDDDSVMEEISGYNYSLRKVKDIIENSGQLPLF
jgi:hypothetical protein